ncbi:MULTISPECIES: hypothetical protein [Nostocales]|uniref:hypothetical protein n=1 Tax=Nostocales TaxID=1161 RepID=UPI00029B7C43|nr:MULTISPECIES: hypothetical protein [Nostocales]AFW94358.1 hypothetical protein ANA_C11584 [Anabaena sp. 90]
MLVVSCWLSVANIFLLPVPCSLFPIPCSLNFGNWSVISYAAVRGKTKPLTTDNP